MVRYLHNDDDLSAGIKALVERDPRLAAVLETAGMPALRRRPPGFPGLAAIVCAQQLSTTSAAAIWGRLSAAFDPFDPARVGRARASTLARLGLSKPKIKTLKMISAAVANGDINLEAVAELPAEEAHAALVRLHGVGPWTADLYLLFCLGHADAWPAGDLALQEAARIAFGLRRRPDAKQMAKLAQAWRPWRGVAAHLLWNYYRVVKRREGVPLQARAQLEQQTVNLMPSKADGARANGADRGR
ncbi:MAG TPA: DNA-3-methyladenine glycosylase 2 family protein [Xanthobacteraceae bacterium]|nr:DNA-3-methyladenine glycosylase 2 family protein [Xanthobacteraceae bacterium]